MPQHSHPGLAIVTGAAAGMGAAAAPAMAEQGWTLLLCDLKDEKLAAAAASLPQSAKVETLAVDIADAQFAPRLASALRGQHVGALVHCAGLSPSMAAAERILHVNLAATIAVLDAVQPLMAEGGAAVVFASSAGHTLGAVLDEAIQAPWLRRMLLFAQRFCADIANRLRDLQARRSVAGPSARDSVRPEGRAAGVDLTGHHRHRHGARGDEG